MRIAITATGNNLDSMLDPRFGRAQFILVVDADGSLIEAIDNSENVAAMGGAGIQAAKLLAERKVDVLLTGRCGPNAVETLNAAGIRFEEVQPGVVKEIVDRFNRGATTTVKDVNPAVNTGAPGMGTGRGMGVGGGRCMGGGRGVGRSGGRGMGGGGGRGMGRGRA